MNVVFDLDGVFCNFSHSFSKVANELFGTPIIHEISEVKSWRWENWYPLDKKQHNIVWRKIDNDIENFWFDMKPLVETNVFKKLAELEYNKNSLFFVTSRRPTHGDTVIKQTYRWIKKYTNLEYFSIIPSCKKGKILEGIDADYCIDDSIENIIEIFNEFPKCKSFLLVRNYNAYAIDFIQKSHKFKNIGIVYSVEEFLDIVENK